MEDLVAVGRIINTHGLKGFVKVISLTDNLDRFKLLDQVRLVKDQLQKERSIEQVVLNHSQEIAYILFSGIADLEQASLLKGSLIMITKGEVMPLPENSYYHFEIIGLEVYSVQGSYLGKIIKVMETGANDVYIMEDERKKEILIPAIKSVVKKVDLDQGKMVVDPPPGLLEI